MHDDGTADAILTIATYPENIFHPIVVLNGDGPVIIASRVPRRNASIAHANQIFFIDINNDQREDLPSRRQDVTIRHVNPDALVGIAANAAAACSRTYPQPIPQGAGLGIIPRRGRPVQRRCHSNHCRRRA
jgi:hypothetical protein